MIFHFTHPMIFPNETPRKYGVASILDVDIEDLSILRLNRTERSVAEQNFILSEQLNESSDQKTIEIHADLFFSSFLLWNRDRLVGSFAKTIVHELGHTVGLVHTNELPERDFEIMTQGRLFNGNPAPRANWNITGEAYKVALGLPWSISEAQKAVDYYMEYDRLGRGDAEVERN